MRHIWSWRCGAAWRLATLDDDLIRASRAAGATLL
jgi:hypothetical protein